MIVLIYEIFLLNCMQKKALYLGIYDNKVLLNHWGELAYGRTVQKPDNRGKVLLLRLVMYAFKPLPFKGMEKDWPVLGQV